MPQPSLLEASIDCVSVLLGQLNSTSIGHEENLTGAMLGMLLASNTLLASLSPQPASSPSPQLWWSSYSKYRGPDMLKTEAGSGADFALMTIPDAGKARIAIFQAKKGELRPDKWKFDPRRKPPVKSAKIRRSQMVVLVETARRLEAISKNKTPTTRGPRRIFQLIDGGTAENVAADLGAMDWIHYLVYTDQRPLCMALKHLTAAYLRELGRGASDPWVEIDGNAVDFAQLVGRGVGADLEGWLELDEDKAIMELPALLPLMPIIVGDGIGEFGAKMQNQPELSSALSPMRIDLGDGPAAQWIAALSNASRPLQPSRPGP